MRLWHCKLIKVLPQAHLVAQWRELSAIAGAIEKNGTPNHVLVNFVLDYDYDNFISYAYYLREEMTSRGIRTMSTVWDKIVKLKPEWTLLPLDKIYEQKWTICIWKYAIIIYMRNIYVACLMIYHQLMKLLNTLIYKWWA